MFGRKVSWLLWFIFVNRTFDFVTGICPLGYSNRVTTNISDLEVSETTYNDIFSYPIKNVANTMNNIFSTINIFKNVQTRIPFTPVQLQTNCGDAFNGQCTKNRYRSIDGTCNNIYNPTWGSPFTRYGRLLPPNYGDGIMKPTISVTGGELPLSRIVSYTLFPSIPIQDKKFTLAAMQWGQIITHDMGLLRGITQSHHHSLRCCTNDGKMVSYQELFNPRCYPIIVPNNDPIIKSDIRCMNFIRTLTDRDSNCKLRNKNAVEQLNTVTHYLDLSIIYGSDNNVANNVRSGIAGRLRADIRDNREWLPMSTNNNSCQITHLNEICYGAGDARVNQNPQLAVLHILLFRDHNRIASVLANLNPHWSDEMIYQETRRIIIAKHQHISYYEWLPLFIGEKQAYENNILYNTNDYVNDYNPKIDPSVLNEHSNAAFRYFHSLIAGYLELIGEGRGSISQPLRLSDHIDKPEIIEQNDNLDNLIRGLSYQRELDSDQFFDEEITLFLFKRNLKYGIDLRATDIQRNRDHGLASYNDFREYCQLPRAEHWNDFIDYITPENIEKLASIYPHPDDVELTVGGSLEQHVPGTLSGPTFLCILLRQFYRTRVGDRFWYETGDHDLAFTREQLREIKKSSISKLFCDNGDNIKLMQPKGFEIVSQSNPLVDCQSLPAMDLSLWKDYAPEIKQNNYQPISVYFQ